MRHRFWWSWSSLSLWAFMRPLLHSWTHLTGFSDFVQQLYINKLPLIFHICEGNAQFSDKGAYFFFPQIKDLIVLFFFFFGRCTKISYVNTTSTCLRHSCRDVSVQLFLNYGQFLSLTNMQPFNWYFVQLIITKFLRKKDKCSRFKSSSSWCLLFLQCT